MFLCFKEAEVNKSSVRESAEEIQGEIGLSQASTRTMMCLISYMGAFIYLIV